MMGSSRIGAGCWVVLSGLLVAQPIAAQGPGQGPAPALPEPQAAGLAARPLLLEPAVQRDLKLTGAQRERLADLDGEADQARQALAEPGEEGFDFAAMVGQAQQVERERGKAIGRILTAGQKHRLAQLEWQREGWLALARPEVVARLKLEPAQKQQIAEVLERLRQDEAGAVLKSATSPEAATGRKLRADLKPSNGFVDPGGGGFADGGPLNFSTDGMAAQEQRQAETIARLRVEAARQVDQILSSGQKSAFLDLLGPRFAFHSLNPGTSAPGSETNRTEKVGRPKSKR